MSRLRASRRLPGSLTARIRTVTPWFLSSVLLILATGSAAAQQEGVREETRPDEMADLAAKSLAVTPQYPLPRESTQIRLEVHNRAAAPVRGVEVAFFANGEPAGTRSIDVAAQAVARVTLAWAPAAAGLQTLSAVVDPRRVLTELDRLDNAITVDVVAAARPPAAADFAITALETVSGADQPGLLRVVVRNEGPVAASAPVVLRRDGTEVVALLAGPIPPRQSLTVEVPWNAAEPGRMSAEVNPRFARAERRSDNNKKDALDPRPDLDLRVEGLSLQAAQVERGRPRTVGVSFRIVNAGRQAIARPFRSRIEPGVMDPDGERPFYVTTPRLPAGGVVHVSHTIHSAPSDFEVTVTVDADQDIAEADEGNNRATMRYSNPAPDVDRWVSIGPQRITGAKAHGYAWNDATGRLSAIAIHPTSPSTMYVGAQSSGVWKTADGGATWQPVADTTSVGVAALALDPGNPSRVFLVTPSEGVFRSDDDGTSWVQVSDRNLSAVVHGGVLLIDPGNTNVLLVASNSGVYRSADGGATWQLTLTGGVATGLIRVPSNPREVYAGIMNPSDAGLAGLYQSLDGGVTWRALAGCPGGSLPAEDANTDIRLAASGSQVFAGYRRRDPRSFRLFRTTGFGCSVGGVLDTSWEPGWNPTGDVDGEPIPAVLWSGLWADPTDADNLYLGGTYFWRSTNNGGSFTRTSGLGSPANGAHVDHHNVATDPLSPNVIYSLNDGGIYRSASRGASGSWSLFGGGIANVEFYDHASAPTQADLVIGGTQDNGTMKTTGGASTWTMIRGGDGATVDIDPTDAQVMYAMFQYADSIARSANGGGSFSGMAAGLPTGAVCFNLPFQVHPRIPTTLLAPCTDLWRTTDPASPWSKILTPAAGAIARTAVDGPADVYYAGSTTGAISMAQSGAGWLTVFSHPGGMGLTDLEIDLDNRAVLYASFGGTGARRIYRLVRGAGSPPSFTAADITSDLLVGRPVQTLAIDRNRPFTVYAGTDRGVFQGRSVNAGLTWFWRPYFNGLPRADVRDLEVHPGTGVMRAATFGRSAYEVNTGPAIGSLLALEGKLTFLRVHDVGTGFGPPLDSIDGEVVAKLDAEPLLAFGFQLRTDNKEEAHRRMLDLLRDAFRADRRIRIEYVRTGLRHGTILRVVNVR